MILKSQTQIISAALLAITMMLSGCGFFGPKDETAEAAALVQEANQEL